MTSPPNYVAHSNFGSRTAGCSAHSPVPPRAAGAPHPAPSPRSFRISSYLVRFLGQSILHCDPRRKQTKKLNESHDGNSVSQPASQPARQAAEPAHTGPGNPRHQQSATKVPASGGSPFPCPGKKPDPPTKLTPKVPKEREVRPECWYQVSCEKFQQSKS